MIAATHVRRHRRGSPQGFTLIELMITVALIAILATIALPSFSGVIRNNRITTQTNDLVTAFTLARNEAITRGRGVTICAADTTNGTPTECGGSDDWGKGWVVFVDNTANDADPASFPEASVLRLWEANPKTTLVADAGQHFVRYTPRGEVRPDEEFVLTMKPDANCSAQQRSVITVSSIGRVSSQRKECD